MREKNNTTENAKNTDKTTEKSNAEIIAKLKQDIATEKSKNETAEIEKLKRELANLKKQNQEKDNALEEANKMIKEDMTPPPEETTDPDLPDPSEEVMTGW